MMFSSTFSSTFSTLFSTRFCTVCKWIIILIIVQRITLLTLTDQIHIIEHNNDNDHDNVGNHHHHHHHNNNDNDSGIVNITIHWPTTTIDDDEEEEDEEDNTTTRVPQSTTTTTMTTTPTTTTKPESILAASTTTTTTGTNSDDSSSSSSSSTILQLPNIQLIGAQKAGTTAIANYLYDIVGVCNGEIYDGEPLYFSKEIHYFDNKLRYQQGLTFYAKRFQHCYSYDHHHENENENDENDESSNNNSNSTNNNDSTNNHKILSMDATPNTLGYAERVYDTYTNLHDNNKQRDELKIIVILREPVARELSLYNHMKSEYTKYVLEGSNETKAILADNTWYTAVANNNNSTGDILTFDEYVQQVTIGKWLRHKNTTTTTTANTTNDDDDNDDNEIIIYHSNYYGTYFYHLRKWFHYFSRNQILVTSYDELINNPKQFEWRILSFLNIYTTTTTETNTIISQTTTQQQQQQQREATMATSTSTSSSSSSSYSSRSSSLFTKSNSQSGSSKTKLPSCNAQEILSNAYKPLNDKLYHLLEGGYNGIYPPIMEQRPFPKFQLGDCIP